jgi:hypothetical protein
MVGWTPGFRLPASLKQEKPMPAGKGYGVKATSKKTKMGGGDGKVKKGMKQSTAPKPGKATRTPKAKMTGGINPMSPAVAKAKVKKG